MKVSNIGFIAIGLFLSGCVSNPDMYSLTGDQVARLNTIQLSTEGLASSHQVLGKAEGVACNHPGSDTEAIQAIRMNAALLEADAVINITCRNAGINGGRCWTATRCVGDAIRFTPETVASATSQETQVAAVAPPARVARDEDEAHPPRLETSPPLPLEVPAPLPKAEELPVKPAVEVIPVVVAAPAAIPAPVERPITAPVVVPVERPVQVVKPAPVERPVIVVKPAPVERPAPVVMAAPVAKPTPVAAAVVKPAPVVVAAPIVKPAPVVMAAPVVKNVPVVRPVPVVKPAPVVVAAPVAKPAPVVIAAPVVKNVPVVRPVPVVKAEPVAKPVPVVKAVPIQRVPTGASTVPGVPAPPVRQLAAPPVAPVAPAVPLVASAKRPVTPVNTSSDMQVTEVTGITVGKDGVEISTSNNSAQFVHFPLDTPGRIVIDVPNGKNAIGKSQFPGNRAGILKVRVGNFGGNLRIVVDLKSKEKPQYTTEKTSKGLRVKVAETDR